MLSLQKNAEEKEETLKYLFFSYLSVLPNK